jgi:hypothetical protein
VTFHPSVNSKRFVTFHPSPTQNGLQSFSPGLAAEAYPGSSLPGILNPEGVESKSSIVQFHIMPQSPARILVDTVFSAKDRRPFLRDKPLCAELHRPR